LIAAFRFIKQAMQRLEHLASQRLTQRIAWLINTILQRG
jgi:hypothetical protein